MKLLTNHLMVNRFPLINHLQYKHEIKFKKNNKYNTGKIGIEMDC